MTSEPAVSASGSDTIIVTGADNHYFEYASELIASIEACAPSPVTIGFLDCGITPDQQAWLLEHGVRIGKAKTGLVLGESPEGWQNKMGYLARPFLRESFPGYALYVWLDADIWLQNWDGITALTQGARAKGAAIITENQRGYRFAPYILAWKLKFFLLGYGIITGLWLAWVTAHAHLNSGVFAMRADAPHWDCWRRRYQAGFDKTRREKRKMRSEFYDQFGLNAAVYLDRLPVEILPGPCNWICELAVPMWHSERRYFCLPYPPYIPISILHLAGDAKTTGYLVQATDGTTSRRGPLRFDADRRTSPGIKPSIQVTLDVRTSG